MADNYGKFDCRTLVVVGWVGGGLKEPIKRPVHGKDQEPPPHSGRVRQADNGLEGFHNKKPSGVRGE